MTVISEIYRRSGVKGEEPTGFPPGYRELVIPSVKLKEKNARRRGGMLIGGAAFGCKSRNRSFYSVSTDSDKFTTTTITNGFH